MKKLVVLLISFILVLALMGCDYIQIEQTDTATTTENTSALIESTTKTEEVSSENLTVDLENIISDSFADTTFFDIQESDPALSDRELKDVIANIPSNKYETYPNTHNVPISATLYKNGEVISIPLDDERLIKLTNFFNNCVYYSQCAYIQSLLSIDYLEKHVNNCDFKLELKYIPYGENGPSAYGTCTTGCDMIVITRDFTLMAHDMPGYEWESENYPFRAVGFLPLYDDYAWLELFGF